MTKAAPPEPAPGRDRTSLVVSLGLVLLFVLGVLALFGENLAALLYPDETTRGSPSGAPPEVPETSNVRPPARTIADGGGPPRSALLT